MRRWLSAVACAALIGFGTAAQPVADSAPFTLRLAATQPAVVSGSRVRLQVALTNGSRHDFRIPALVFFGPDLGEFIYNVTVTERNGQPAPSTAYARWFPRQIWSGNAPAVVVKPGQTFDEGIILSRLADITVPGTYTVQVWTNWRGYPIVRSNSVKLRVLGPGAR